MFLRGERPVDLPRGTDLEFSLGGGETSLRTVDAESGSALGSWQPQARLVRGGLRDCIRHTRSVWSDLGGRGVSPAGRAGGNLGRKGKDEILLVQKHF